MNNTQNRDRINSYTTTMRTQGTGLVELDKKSPRGFIGSPMQSFPDVCEARFDNNNLMPSVASKFKRDDQATIFKT
jgi:hypothetical protein